MKTPCISSGRSEARTETSCHPSSSAISEPSPARARQHAAAESEGRHVRTAAPAARARQHAAEVSEVRHVRTEALDPAADHELLIEDADGAEACVGFRHDGAQNTVHALAPLRQFLGTEWLLHRFGTDL